jgi:hypothetical protein
MRYRKLRIAWSVGCQVAGVLLLVLWMRSYFAWDSPNGPFFGNRWIQFNSLRGHLFVSIHDRQRPGDFTHWNFRILRVDSLTNRGATGTVAWDFAWKVDALAFGFVEAGKSLTLFVRYWFLVLAATAFAAIPWIKWPWRFRIRTLLIWMSLFAFLLAMDRILGAWI